MVSPADLLYVGWMPVAARYRRRALMSSGLGNAASWLWVRLSGRLWATRTGKAAIARRPGQRPPANGGSAGTASSSRGQRLKSASSAHLALDPRELVPEAEMDPGAKRQVAIGSPREIERFGVRVGVGVHVGRRQHGHDPVALFQLNPAELDIASDEARLAKLYR